MFLTQLNERGKSRIDVTGDCVCVGVKIFGQARIDLNAVGR
jgi:hypothetical protein